MSEYTFGANILENITMGMYQDSKVIYREYIQNACDQIDKAEQLGILRKRSSCGNFPDLGEGEINIWHDISTRKITIEDNATGIQASEFVRILGNIADSDKVVGQDKGFRGIGRLCGLAYCKELVFTTRWKGEDVVSIMTCNAIKMREMINEANTNIQKYSASDVLHTIFEFTTRQANNDDPEHFFRVELNEVNKENTELFGEKNETGTEDLTNYLSFVAPVPYNANFIYRTEIYKHSSELKTNIDEYTIKLNGAQIFKKYKTHLKTGNGLDDVYGVEFNNFIDDNNQLIAWMWFGKTTFKAAIKNEEISRGLRLRKENIQIGDESALRDLFTREASKRGNGYFIGEIFAVSPELIPNSQRSYFNENHTRVNFENTLRNYFDNTLYDIYYDGSEINSSINKINSYAEKENEFNAKVSSGAFVSVEERDKEKQELEKKKDEAEKARKVIEKKKVKGRSILAKDILNRRLPDLRDNYQSPGDCNGNTSTQQPQSVQEDELANNGFLTDTLFPNNTRKEKKLLSNVLEKIFSIINNSTDKKTAAKIIHEIKDNLK